MKLPRPYTIQEIAKLLGLNYRGDGSLVITSISDVYHANYGDITFADNEKYYDIANQSNASAIIVEQEVTETTPKALIFSSDAYEAYNRLANLFFPVIQQTQLIHPSAHVGKNTLLFPNVFVGANVTIGDSCIIYSNVSINNNSIIGNNVTIQSGSVIGSDAFYFVQKEDKYCKLTAVGFIEIEDHVEIGANVTIDKGLGGITHIGKGCKIGNSVQIGHDTHIAENCLIAAQSGIASNVILEENVVIWGQVGIQKNVIIGKDAVVLGQSGVTKSLEGGKIYFGLPAIESREKMKELAYIKQIPSLIKLLSEKL
jgi:UDP-3-O-[3-hydroxymyristoyl] glucosamine N-acyltransferase